MLKVKKMVTLFVLAFLSVAFVGAPSAAAQGRSAHPIGDSVTWDAIQRDGNDCLDTFDVWRSAGSVMVAYTGSYLPLVGKSGTLKIWIRSSYWGYVGVSKFHSYTALNLGVFPYGSTVYLELFEGNYRRCSGYYAAA